MKTSYSFSFCFHKDNIFPHHLFHIFKRNILCFKCFFTKSFQILLSSYQNRLIDQLKINLVLYFVSEKLLQSVLSLIISGSSGICCDQKCTSIFSFLLRGKTRTFFVTCHQLQQNNLCINQLCELLLHPHYQGRILIRKFS